MKIKIIGIDSSLNNTGVAVGYYDSKTQQVTIEKISLLENTDTNKAVKKQVRASTTTVKKCRNTYEFISDIIKSEEPKVIFAETPSGSKSFSAGKSYGTTCQLIGSIYPEPLELTPTEVKKNSIGSQTASKKEIIQWAYNLWPNLTWNINKTTGALKNKNEHMADAIAIIYAGVQDIQFKQLIHLICL